MTFVIGTLPVRLDVSPLRSPSLLLVAAIAVPLAYFGAQLAAAPFFPDYSVLTVSASALGSDRSSRPEILNIGAMLTGLLALLGSVGMGWALPKLGATRILSWLLASCVASIGLASLWAGSHPLPSAQHDPGALGAGMFAAPFVSALVAWRVAVLRPLRWPLLVNVAAFGGCAWVLSGAAGVDLAAYGGLAQKCLAAVSFVPPSAIAFRGLEAAWQAARLRRNLAHQALQLGRSNRSAERCCSCKNWAPG